MRHNKWVHERCSGISWKLTDDIDLHCKQCLKDGPDQHVLLKEVEIEPNVKLECVAKFCYLINTLGEAGRDVDEASIHYITSHYIIALCQGWYRISGLLDMRTGYMVSGKILNLVKYYSDSHT